MYFYNRTPFYSTFFKLLALSHHGSTLWTKGSFLCGWVQGPGTGRERDVNSNQTHQNQTQGPSCQPKQTGETIQDRYVSLCTYTLVLIQEKTLTSWGLKMVKLYDLGSPLICVTTEPKRTREK